MTGYCLRLSRSVVFSSAEAGAFVFSSWGTLSYGKSSFGGSVVACVAASAATRTGGAEEELGVEVARLVEHPDELLIGLVAAPRSSARKRILGERRYEPFLLTCAVDNAPTSSCWRSWVVTGGTASPRWSSGGA